MSEKAGAVRVGTRRSELARLQTDRVVAELRLRYPDVAFELREVVTEGDAVPDRRLVDMGGRGVFVKEIEERLLGGSIDLAVHSCKDLPSRLPAELSIAAVPERVDASDVLISRSADGITGLPRRARVGTGSPRREAQLRLDRPDLTFHPVRGNLNTRLRKLTSGEAGLDALVLAAAGLERLGWIGPADRPLPETGVEGSDGGPTAGKPPSPTPLRWAGGEQGWWAVRLPFELSLPAVGQGALALECRAGDDASELVRAVDDPLTRAAITAERGFLLGVRGGCHTPVGAHANWMPAPSGRSAPTDRSAYRGRSAPPDGSAPAAPRGPGRLVLRAVIAAEDGSDVVRDELETEMSAELPGVQACEALGGGLAERMLRRGGARLLRARPDVRRSL